MNLSGKKHDISYKFAKMEDITEEIYCTYEKYFKEWNTR